MNDNPADLPFHRALTAINAGYITELESLIARHPGLVTHKLRNGRDGYFKDPYLLWFVAENPVRTGTLPANIAEVTRLLSGSVKACSPDTFQHQVNYALSLVASGRIPREYGVQNAMIDILIDEGAAPGGAMDALTNGNEDAARHLISRGAKVTLALAACLGLTDYFDDMAANADTDEKLTALAAAAFYGKTDTVKRLLAAGASPNGYPSPDSGFHSHATPLHQAVSSGSLASVKLLAEAGAMLDAPDKAYNGTPPGWAAYLQREEGADEHRKSNLSLIESYLQSREITP